MEALGDTCPAHPSGACGSSAVLPPWGAVCPIVLLRPQGRALHGGQCGRVTRFADRGLGSNPNPATVRLGDPASAPRPESPLPHLKKCVRSFLPCRQGQRAGTQVPGTHRTLDVPFPSSFSKPEASSGSLEEGALETAITGGRWAKASLLNRCAQLYAGHGTRRSDPSTELPAPPPRVLRLMESYSTNT